MKEVKTTLKNATKKNTMARLTLIHVGGHSSKLSYTMIRLVSYTPVCVMPYEWYKTRFCATMLTAV